VAPICFLFDLDGTLVTTGGAGMRAFDRAFRERFGRPAQIRSVSPAGKTDPEILAEVCLRALGRLPAPREEEALFRRYTELLEEELRRTSDFRVHPGIPEVLSRLHGRAGCLLGLGTGNIREGARIKLEIPGLWHYFRFGGFGGDGRDRKALLEAALRRGRALVDGGTDFERVYVVGDTPRDVAAGRAVGARVIGVATGPYSAEALERAAFRVFPDLGDPDSFLDLVLE